MLVLAKGEKARETVWPLSCFQVYIFMVRLCLFVGLGIWGPSGVFFCHTYMSPGEESSTIVTAATRTDASAGIEAPV